MFEDQVLIIAEAGSNWRQGTQERDLHMARQLIDAAVEAKADAVKFQTFRAENVYSAGAGMPGYLEKNAIKNDIHALFRDLAMPYEMIPALAAYCEKRGILFLSTPFSKEDFAAVDPYVSLHKIASYEISHIRLLELAASTKKPLILSTGASSEEDIDWAVQHFFHSGGSQLALLQCTLQYPTAPEEVHLQALPWLAQRFSLPVGLSDHTREPLCAPIAAVALGARVIEKHFTLHNKLPGPDHNFAITAEELAELVQALRKVERMLGSSGKGIGKGEEQMFSFGRRRVQALRDMRAGELFQEGINIEILRPGNCSKGLHPRYLKQLAGKPCRRDIARGEGIREGDW